MAVVSRWARAALAVVAAGTLLAACGDDKESSSSTTTTLATTTTLSQIQLDRQKADRVVLAAADVPGYTMDAPEPDDESPELEAAANACVNNNPVLVVLGTDNDPRGVNGPDFSKGDEATISSSVTFAETEEQATAAIAAASVATFPNCFSRALATELRKPESGFTNVTVATAKLPALTVGSQSVGYRSTVRGRVQGQALTMYFDFTFIRAGRGVAVLDGFAFGTALPEAERVRLATLLAQRMAA
jgi:hypothetical protein